MRIMHPLVPGLGERLDPMDKQDAKEEHQPALSDFVFYQMVTEMVEEYDGGHQQKLACYASIQEEQPWLPYLSTQSPSESTDLSLEEFNELKTKYQHME